MLFHGVKDISKIKKDIELEQNHLVSKGYGCEMNQNKKDWTLISRLECQVTLQGHFHNYASDEIALWGYAEFQNGWFSAQLVI